MSATMTITPTTPTSPKSPVRKRRSLRIPSIQSNYEPPSPSLSQNAMIDMPSRSRRSSQSSSQYPLSTPRPTSSRSKRPSLYRLSVGSNISTGLASNPGFGNLADELEEIWDPELDSQEESFLQDLGDGEQDVILRSPSDILDIHDSEALRSPQSPTMTNNLLQPPDKPPSPSKQWASMGTHRKTESLYDGSDYGPSSDDEAFDSITPTLQRRIHDIEEITRISENTDSLSESGGVIARTTSALRDNLGNQASIESGLTRLITAYTSMSTHRVHQAREVLGASHALSTNTTITSTLFDLPVETIELLIDEVDSLTSALPFLPTSPQSAITLNPLATLQTFAATSHELISMLHALLDTITEHRQHLLTATRRLKTVRDLVEDLRIEEDGVDTSIMLIHAGDWDRRCRERHAGKAAAEVLEGFRRAWQVDYVEDAWRPSLASRREIQVR